MKYDFTTCRSRLDSGSAKWAEMKRKKADIPAGTVPFSVADMEFVTAPEIVRGLQEFLEREALGYTDATDRYYDAVTGWMKRRHGWDVEKEWIVLSPGVVVALGIAIRAYTQPGDGVIIMPPVYYPFTLMTEGNGRKVVCNELLNTGRRYDIDFDDLERKAKDSKNKLLLLCSPHNPVGRVWTEEELRRVAEICNANDVLVVSDEIHADLVMPGHRHMVYSKVAGNNCVICTAPSKTFNLAGMQASNIIIPDGGLRKKFMDTRLAMGLIGLNAPAYRACEIAYTRCEAWLEELLLVIDQNRQMVKDFIAAHIPQVTVLPMEGTYLQWLDMRYLGCNDAELERRMIAENLFFDEGCIFGAGGSGFERINIACPQDVLQDGLKRLEQVLR